MTKPFIFKIWGPDQILRLKAMWAAGMSADDIAARLGCFTPQQVKDKAHRDGFRRASNQVKPQLIEPWPVMRSEGEPICMANVASDECHWIYDEPTATAQMCGNHIEGHGPWCPFHQGRAYQ